MLYDQYFIDDLKDRADLVRRITVWLFVLIALTSHVSSQDVRKAELVDEFSLLLTCEDILARTDAFAAEIGRNPHSSAIILIAEYGPLSRNANRVRRLVESTLQFRGIEPEQLRTFTVTGKPSASFWLMPPGSELPYQNAVELEKPKFDLTKPFIFGSADELEICPTFVPKAFAKLLKDNPGSRGHIVITAGNDPNFNRSLFAKEWLDVLVERQGIPRNRLRLFFAKDKGSAYAQFWFVPARRR